MPKGVVDLEGLKSPASQALRALQPKPGRPFSLTKIGHVVLMSTDLERFGKLERAGKTLHRFRLGDYRIYFERHELGLVVHRILSRNSLKDFLYRSSLPVAEDEALQQNPKFWELIESARGSSARNP